MSTNTKEDCHMMLYTPLVFSNMAPLEEYRIRTPEKDINTSHRCCRLFQGHFINNLGISNIPVYCYLMLPDN
jgi:hypothetical protein